MHNHGHPTECAHSLPQRKPLEEAFRKQAVVSPLPGPSACVCRPGEALRRAKSHKIYLDTCEICSPTACVLPVEKSVQIYVINRNFIIRTVCFCLGSKCRNFHQHFLSLSKVLETLTNISAFSEMPRKKFFHS